MAPKHKGPPRTPKGSRITAGKGNSGGSSQSSGSSQAVGSSHAVGSAHSGGPAHSVGGSAHSGGGSALSAGGSALSAGGSALSAGGSAHSGGGSAAARSKELTWMEETIKQKNDEIKDGVFDTGKADVDVHELVKEIENYRRAVEDPAADRLRSSSEAGSPSK